MSLNSEKSYQPYKLIYGVTFLFLFVVLIISRSTTTRFASMGFRQSKSNSLLPVFQNHPISQEFTDLNVETILFFPKLNDVSLSFRHPLYVKILFHDSGLVQGQKCPLLQLLFFHQCKITRISQQLDRENPAKITFYSEAPQGVYRIWGTIREEEINGEEIRPTDFYTIDLEFYGYDPTPNMEIIRTTFHYFFISIGFSLLITAIGIGPVYILYHKDDLNWDVFLIMSLFLGIAIIVLLLLVCGLFNFPYRYVPLVAIAFVVINFVIILVKIKERSERLFKASINKDTLLLLATFLFATWIYSWQIAEVLAPLWFDGLFHSQLVDGILLNNDLLTGSIYPTGFHALAVFLNQLFGVKNHQAIFLAGQWIILISGLSFFVFARKVTKSFVAAWIGVLIYWFFSTFPNYLVNWSRFPFAMGLGLIPISLLFTIYFLNSSKYKLFISVMIFLLGFTHYGAFLLFIAGALSVRIIYVSKERRILGNLTKNRRVLGVLVVFLFGMGYLLFRAINFFFSGNWMSVVNQNRFNAESVDYVYAFGLTAQKGGWALYFISILVIIMLLKKGNKLVAYFALWAVFANMIIFLFQLILGASILSIENLIYFLPIPMSILAGIGVMYASEIVRTQIKSIEVLINHQKLSKYLSILGWTVIIMCILLSGYHQSAILNPRVVMVTEHDLDAFKWIDENIAESSNILVNSTLWGNQYKPVGSGGWIPAFTNREVYFPENRSDKVSIFSFIAKNEIDYLFMGEGVGEIDSEWFKDFPIVYQRGEIQIFELGQVR